MAVNTTVEVAMPAMGESVSDGTILEWHKQEGDAVAEDETLVEISTDKVDAEVPAPAAGTVVKIHVAEGDTVDVGAVLAEIAPTGDGNGRPPPRGARRRAEAAAPSRAPPTPRRRRSRSTMPADGRVGLRGHDPRVAQAARRRRRRGRDDRRDLDRQGRRRGARARAPGTMTEILAQAGETVTVGQVIARMTAGAGARRSPPPAPAPEPTAAPRPAGDVRPPRPRARRSRRSPRRVAAAHGVDLGAVTGHRPRRADLQGRRARRASNGADRAAAPARRARDAAQGRRGDARALHGRVALDPDRDLVPHDHRHRRSTAAASSSRRPARRVSFTHLIAYAIARAATEQMPVMAHAFAEIDGKPHVRRHGQVNLGIAVDVEKKDGGAHADGARSSATPAGSRSPSFLDAFDDLIARARENKLDRGRPPGRQRLAHQPGRHRHDRLASRA